MSITAQPEKERAEFMSGTLKKEKYQVRVLRTFAEIEETRDFWFAVRFCPESDLDFVRFIVKNRPEILRPYVLVVSSENHPVALIVGRIENAHFDVKIGYKSFWRTPIRRLAIFYGGFMGQSEPEIVKVAIRQLLHSLREEKADLLLWNGVQLGTDLHHYLTTMPGLLYRDHLAQPVQHWHMSLLGSMDEIIEKRMSKKHRYWAKRLFRQLEKDFPAGIRLACSSKPDEMDQFFREVMQIVRKTYQWGLGVGFRDDAEHKERLKLEAVSGWHRGYILYLNNQPAAFWICVVYKGIAYSAFTGYDPQYRKYELGTVLFLKMIGELSQEGIKLLDFGPGTALYKERFGDSNFEETTLCAYAATFRGILFNSLRTSTDGPVQAARKLLRRFGIEQKIKKIWRRSATSSHSTTEVPEPEA